MFDWLIRSHQWTPLELAVVAAVLLLLASVAIDVAVGLIAPAIRAWRVKRDVRGRPGNYADPATRHHVEQR